MGKQMKMWVAAGVGALAGAAVVGLMRPASAVAEKVAEAHVMASTPEAAGKYLVSVGGCNDCHTPGFMMMGSKVPEEQWLTGVPMGWNGPWGTTYASNLRLQVREFDEDLWVATLRARNARPPMPWESLHAMNEQDLRAVYRYIKSLGPAGEKMPAALGPGETPKTPYLVMTPQMAGK
jgi:mono/diheme cytochrome c family protein